MDANGNDINIHDPLSIVASQAPNEFTDLLLHGMYIGQLATALGNAYFIHLIKEHKTGELYTNLIYTDYWLYVYLFVTTACLPLRLYICNTLYNLKYNTITIVRRRRRLIEIIQSQYFYVANIIGYCTLSWVGISTILSFFILDTEANSDHELFHYITKLLLIKTIAFICWKTRNVYNLIHTLDIWIDNPVITEGFEPESLHLYTRIHTIQSQEQVYLNQDCAICMNKFTVGEDIRLINNCRHYYHPHCIDQWFLNSPKCPLCRRCIHISRSPSIEDINLPD